METPETPEILLLSREEIANLQRAALKGEIPSLDLIRRYVFTTRASYLSSSSKAKPKDRLKKPDKTDDRQIDFF